MGNLIALSNRSSDGVIYVDDRYFPLIVMYWTKSPDADLCTDVWTWRDQMLERAIAQGDCALVVHHLNKDNFSPPATARQRTAELAPTRSELLGNYVVAASALLRGVMTAIKWMAGDAIKVTTYARIDDALDKGIEALRASGTKVLLKSSKDYTPPEGMDAS